MNIFLGVLLSFLVWVVFQTQHTPWVEMLTYPYLLNHGFVLYKDLIAPYTPLLLWFLQLVEGLFGYTPQVSQWLTIIFAFTNTLIVWYVAKKLWKNNLSSLTAAAFYVLWFQYFEGNGLWFELLQTPFIILAFYFFYRYFFPGHLKKDLIWGSVFLAVAFFMKQSVAWIVLAVVGWGIRGVRGIRGIRETFFLFLLPFFALFVITSVVTYFGGYLKDYWWWAFYYTFIQFPFTPGHNLYPTSSQLVKLMIPLIILGPLILEIFKKEKKAVFSLLFLIAVGMAVLPRWSLFHLQPFLALTAVIAVPYFWRWLEKRSVRKVMAVVLVAVIWTVVIGRQIGRFYSGGYRFWGADITAIAERVKNLGDDIFIFNGPDQLYVENQSSPQIKPYVQNFAWEMEVPGIQERVVESLKQERTSFIVFSPFSGKGGYLIGDYRPKLLADYIDQNYHVKTKLTDGVLILEINR